MIGGIGIEKNASLLPFPGKTLPVVLFHGDSITHGHGNNSPRRKRLPGRRVRWRTASPSTWASGRRTAWADRAIAEYIASRNDWDVLVLELGTNSFGGVDSSGKSEKASDYKKKYDDFVGVVRAKFPDKPIIAITPILTRTDITMVKNRNGELPGAYRNVIRDSLELRRKTDRRLLILDGMKFILRSFVSSGGRSGSSQCCRLSPCQPPALREGLKRVLPAAKMITAGERPR